MSRFPTRAEKSIVIAAPASAVYSYVWNVASACRGIPGLSVSRHGAEDTYRFEYSNDSQGPVTLQVRYTAKFIGNGKDKIRYFSSPTDGEDTAEVEGCVLIREIGPGKAQLTLRQELAPETPVPRFLPNLLRAYVQTEATAAVEAYLRNAKRNLESQPERACSQ